jgi:hypothetical protein
MPRKYIKIFAWISLAFIISAKREHCSYIYIQAVFWLAAVNKLYSQKSLKERGTALCITEENNAFSFCFHMVENNLGTRSRRNEIYFRTCNASPTWYQSAGAVDIQINPISFCLKSILWFFCLFYLQDISLFCINGTRKMNSTAFFSTF